METQFVSPVPIFWWYIRSLMNFLLGYNCNRWKKGLIEKLEILCHCISDISVSVIVKIVIYSHGNNNDGVLFRFVIEMVLLGRNFFCMTRPIIFERPFSWLSMQYDDHESPLPTHIISACCCCCWWR